MRTITSKTPHDSSFSFSRRYLNWTAKKSEENKNNNGVDVDVDEDEDEVVLKSLSSSIGNPNANRGKAKKGSAVAKLLSFLGGPKRRRGNQEMGTKVVGTLFGHRRGHVHIAFQEEAKSSPALLIELAMPTSVLVREMASGLVRIALECDRSSSDQAVWRTYCNGRKCGLASRTDCGPDEWNVLRAVGPISMGAGVLPSCGSGPAGFEGELMYMRARFERVVGSNHSQAFYMMNPDASGGPELSIYFLRV